MKKKISIMGLLLGSVASSYGAGVSAAEYALDKVIVSGEKSSRSMAETASSVMVLTNEDLENLPGLQTSADVLDRVPNIVTVEPGNEAPAIRGVDGTGPASGANAFFAGTRPRLNYQLDGRTLGFNESLFQSSSLWDVEQVEVYRGPQSTLQGRNSIAGAIIMRSADPTFDWQSKVRAQAGSQQERGGSFALSGPLLQDTLAFRVAGDFQRSKTAVDFTPYSEESEPDLYRNQLLRGKLLFTPAENVRSILTVGRTDGKSPQSERVVRPFSDRDAEFPYQPTFRSINKYGVWDSQWQLSDFVSIEMNLSATDFITDRNAPSGQGNLTVEGKEKVFQPYVRIGKADDRVSGFIAAYIFRTYQDEEIDLFGGGGFRDETESNALFGEMIWNITDVTDLTLGGRYEKEERYREGAAGPLGLDYNETYKVFLPKATVSWQGIENWTLGFTGGRGYNGGGAGITFASPFVAYTYDPEYVQNYEAFARRLMLGGRLNLTTNVFYNNYKDMQLPFSLSSSATVIRNAEKATTYGAEAGLNYYLESGDQVFASIGLLKTRVDEYDDDTVEGNDLARAPAYSLALGIVSVPFTNIEVSADIRYSDAYYSDATNTARGKVDPYAIANAQVSYRLTSFRAYLLAENLFDSNSEVSILTGDTAADDSATLLNPRTFTLGAEYSF